VGAVLGAVRTVGEGHAEGTRPAAAGPGLVALFFARQRRGCCGCVASEGCGCGMDPTVSGILRLDSFLLRS